MPCNTPLLLSYIMFQDGSLNVKLTGFLQGLKALATKQLAIKSESDTNNYLCWLWVCWRMGSHILAIPRDCHLFSFFLTLWMRDDGCQKQPWSSCFLLFCVLEKGRVTLAASWLCLLLPWDTDCSRVSVSLIQSRGVKCSCRSQGTCALHVYS